jgi:hypothetical protein
MDPVRIYLDSSDYSVLSDPARLDSSLQALLDDLRRWVADGAIECVFSGTILSEMAPIESQYVDAARRRADILVELCGQHAVVSQDVLFKGELRFALGLIEVLPQAYSCKAEWYPEGVEEMSPVGELHLAANIRDTIKELGFNRQQRRAAERRALRNGLPRPSVQAAAVANARGGSLDEILEKYPMRPNDARVLARYIVGDATAAEASEAFLSSLRDPRWMMRWFEQHHSKLTPFIEWVRVPAESMHVCISHMAEHAAKVREADLALGTTLSKSLFSAAQWQQQQDQMLGRIATSIAKAFLQIESAQLTSALIDEKCPGISVGIRSLHSAWRATTFKSPRKPKLSDFPDCLHAIYAPYVDIFRADSFMAPYIQKAVIPYGTVVADRLNTLGPTLRRILDGRGKT